MTDILFYFSTVWRVAAGINRDKEKVRIFTGISTHNHPFPQQVKLSGIMVA